MLRISDERIDEKTVITLEMPTGAINAAALIGKEVVVRRTDSNGHSTQEFVVSQIEYDWDFPETVDLIMRRLISNTEVSNG